MPQTELQSRTLWLSVWDADKFGRNQFLGEVRLPLSSLDLTTARDWKWYDLQDEVGYIEVRPYVTFADYQLI